MTNPCYFCGEPGRIEQQTTAGLIWICGCNECVELFSATFIRRSQTVWSDYGDFRRDKKGKLIDLRVNKDVD